MTIKSAQKGAIHLLILLAFLIIIAAAAFLIFNNQKNPSPSQPVQKLPVTSTASSPKEATTTSDKKDPNWLKDYCEKEVIKLPEPPFTYQKKREVKQSMADTFLLKYIPEDKQSQEETCTASYDFDSKTAYASMGVDYGFDITNIRSFEERVDNLYSAKTDVSWKKISPIGQKEAGRPGYVYKGFPLVFTRETKATGTVEYATVSFGADVLYVKFTAYEK